MEIYKSLPLQRNSQDIRILALEYSDDEHVPIVADLKVISLAVKPRYFALSYTWGTSGFSHSVQCNGFPFPITENLYLALRRLRRSEKRVLWVDQICINQSSISERDHQVGFMFTIYQMAENVCVWLGIQQENTGLGLEHARHLASSLGKKPDRDRLQGLLSDSAYFQEPALNSFYQLYESPWFLRCWVVQEVLAKPNPTAFCGDFEFEWKILPFAQVALLTDVHLPMQFAGRGKRSDLSKKGSSCCLAMAFEFGDLVDDLCLDDAIANTAFAKALRVRYDTIDFFLGSSDLLVTDPRDKVYAFLGLARTPDDQIKPDYGLSVQETYYNLSKCLVLQNLGRSLIATTGLAWRQTESLPSWCLDLNFLQQDGKHRSSLFQYAKVYGLHLQAGSASLGKYIIGPASSELTVMGVKVDVIKELGPARVEEKGFYMRSMLSWMKESRQLLSDFCGTAGLRYPSWKERFPAFCRLVVADDDRFSQNAVQSHLTFVSYQLECWKISCSEDKDKATMLQETREWMSRRTQFIQEYEEVFSSITSGRQLCITEKGYLGLVHGSAHVRDEICVVVGCGVPLVMRDAPLAKEKRVLVSDAFVVDLMDGQALAAEDVLAQDLILQ